MGPVPLVEGIIELIVSGTETLSQRGTDDRIESKIEFIFFLHSIPHNHSTATLPVCIKNI